MGTVNKPVQSGPSDLSGIPDGLEFTAVGGKLDSKDWVFENLSANNQFDTVAYIPDLAISWKVV